MPEPRITPADLEDLRGPTIKQPWLWAIDMGLKPGENRTRPLPQHLVGRWIALHAGAAYSYQGADWIQTFQGKTPPLQRELPRMAITSLAKFAASVKVGGAPSALWGRMEKPPEGDWKEGPWWWPILERVVLPAPILIPGGQGPWRVPEDVVAHVWGQLGVRADG